MSSNKVIIIGSSGHAKVVIDTFEKSESHTILGLIDDYRRVGEITLGYPVLGRLDDLTDLVSKHGDCELFIAIGDNWVRKQVYTRIVAVLPNAIFAKAIHPSVQMGKAVELGQGVALMAGSVINSASSIGDFCIVNTRSSIDHDNLLHAFASIAPGATTGGNVTVGECAALSIGATVKHKVTIGAHAIVGAGAVLLSDCGACEVVYGVPAKPIRKRQPGDRYL